ncbi:hypothetical protein K6W81_18590 [Enterobacter sp. MW07]|nr:hypothetical protein [Enterobacter sp. MW07]
MLDFIRDIFSAFRQTSLERIKSPFLGAFVFSWVAFNWQAILILIFSDRTIEKRLVSINESYDIGSFLLGPICTSILISFLLPQINKLITRIQDKPNSDTIELTLSSKIKIAQLQQSIAELEAKKKLADKREEKNIDANIDAIKDDNKKLTDKVNSYEMEILELKSSLSESKIEENKYRAQMDAAIEARDKLETTLKKTGEANTSLNITVRELSEKNKNTETLANSLHDDLAWERNDKKRLEEIISSYQNQIIDLNNKYPSIFKNQIKNINKNKPIQIELTEQAKKSFPEINNQMNFEAINDIFNRNK